jgi:hypothetical protein
METVIAVAELMVTCPSCHKEVLEGSWCPLCGARLSELAWLAGLGSTEPPTPFPEAGKSGWYPIADTPGQQRYWDGYRWTDRFRQAPEVPADASPGSVPDGDLQKEPESDVDPVDQLERLANLKDKGLLTEQEFEEAKRRLLNRI